MEHAGLPRGLCCAPCEQKEKSLERKKETLPSRKCLMFCGKGGGVPLPCEFCRHYPSRPAEEAKALGTGPCLAGGGKVGSPPSLPNLRKEAVVPKAESFASAPQARGAQGHQAAAAAPGSGY